MNGGPARLRWTFLCLAVVLSVGCGGVQAAKEPAETIVVDAPTKQGPRPNAGQSGQEAVAPRVNSKSEKEKVELAVNGFLDYLKSQAPPISDRFQAENGGKIDIEELRRHFPKTGVVFTNVNSEEGPKQFSLEDLRSESTAGKIDQGSAIRQLLHLGYIASHPQPQYSRLQYEELGNAVWLVRVANWYKIQLRVNGDSVVVERVEYVMGEDL